MDKSGFTANPKMFMNWKVPERVTTGDASRASSRIDRSRSSQKRNAIPHANPPQSTSALPLIDHQSAPKAEPQTQSAIPATPRLPTRLNTGTHRLSLRGASRASDRAASLRASAPQLPTSRNGVEKPMPSRKPKSYKISELLDRYYMPSDTPEEWMANASDADRAMIEKALRLLEKDKLSKKDSKKSLEEWIRNASEKDRAVALKFFQSLADDKEGLSNQSPDKIRMILEQLRRGRLHPGVLPPEGASRHNSLDHKYRYLRLQTPNTRANKWMYQTWHHLPDARNNNPVINRTSIYTEPHKFIPSHYVIHPDLG